MSFVARKNSILKIFQTVRYVLGRCGNVKFFIRPYFLTDASMSSMGNLTYFSPKYSSAFLTKSSRITPKPLAQRVGTDSCIRTKRAYGKFAKLIKNTVLAKYPLKAENCIMKIRETQGFLILDGF